MEDTRIYTGVTKYKDIDFTFVFNGENLRLIPTTENVRKVETEWLMTPIAIYANLKNNTARISR